MRVNANLNQELVPTTIAISGIATAGSQIITNSGAPSDTFGMPGDYYIDSVTQQMYGPKTTTWGLSTTSLGGSGIKGGYANQVLVKLSNVELDYEWQDMNVIVPVYTKLIDRIDEHSMYVGEAVPGTNVLDISWRIKKIIVVSNEISIQYADGVSTFNKNWSIRNTYNYF